MNSSSTIYFQPDSKSDFYPNIKKDNLEIAENYKPISTTGAFWQIFEKFLCKKINECRLFNNLLSNTWFGFRTSYSTIDAILHCIKFFRKTMDKSIRCRNFIRSIQSFWFQQPRKLKEQIERFEILWISNLNDSLLYKQ